jgi:hypothetical protein
VHGWSKRKHRSMIGLGSLGYHHMSRGLPSIQIDATLCCIHLSCVVSCVRMCQCLCACTMCLYDVFRCTYTHVLECEHTSALPSMPTLIARGGRSSLSTSIVSRRCGSGVMATLRTVRLFCDVRAVITLQPPNSQTHAKVHKSTHIAQIAHTSTHTYAGVRPWGYGGVTAGMEARTLNGQ